MTNRIIIADGSEIKRNDILRYRKGEHALMMYINSEETAFGRRLYGKHINGDAHAAWAHDCTRATPEEVQRWLNTERDRYI